MIRPSRMSETISDLERCYTSALRILNYRFNSREELRRKLVSKKFDEPTVAATLARLDAEKWLDDERFAGAFVRTRARRRIGRNRIERELGAAGVDAEAIARALRENVDPEAQREAASALCEKRFGMLARRKGTEFAAGPEGRNKLTGYLLNQGYDAALVRDVVREVLRRLAT